VLFLSLKGEPQSFSSPRNLWSFSCVSLSPQTDLRRTWVFLFRNVHRLELRSTGFTLMFGMRSRSLSASSFVNFQWSIVQWAHPLVCHMYKPRRREQEWCTFTNSKT
jgi:hypothetical protein